MVNSHAALAHLSEDVGDSGSVLGGVDMVVALGCKSRKSIIER